MAVEFKYGKVTLEKGTIPDDEPVVVFRAQDKMLPELLDAYHAMCVRDGSPIDHLVRIKETRARIVVWQREHKTKVPD